MAPPDHPIYKTGLTIGGQHAKPSTPPTPPTTAGTTPAKGPKKPRKKSSNTGCSETPWRTAPGSAAGITRAR